MRRLQLNHGQIPCVSEMTQENENENEMKEKGREKERDWEGFPLVFVVPKKPPINSVQFAADFPHSCVAKRHLSSILPLRPSVHLDNR